MARIIKLLYADNRVVVEPTTDEVKGLLEPVCTYTERKAHFGRERYRRQKLIDEGTLSGRADQSFTRRECFAYDFKDRFYSSFGLYGRMTERLVRAGYKVELVEVEPPKRPEIFEPQWDRVFEHIDPRHKQVEVLAAVASNPCGRIDCPTGYGKSMLIRMILELFPKAKIDIISSELSVVDMLHSDLSAYKAGIGIVTGSKRKYGNRVTVYSAHSLGRSRFDADIVLADECHTLSADKFGDALINYEKARRYGFSASHGQRGDGRTLREEALFGPIIISIPYEEAEAKGLVNSIEVHWGSVPLPQGAARPWIGKEGPAYDRNAYWRNHFRNKQIAKDARGFAGIEFSDDTAVLIAVSKLDQALRLKKLLPDFTLVYAENALDRPYHWSDREETVGEWAVRKGLISKDEPKMTGARRKQLRLAFEKGTLKKVIATTVWNTGVNFKELSVLIRGDCGGAISDTQLPGRLARIADGKPVSLLRDYLDEFDKRAHGRARSKFRRYAKHKWRQVLPRGFRWLD